MYLHIKYFLDKFFSILFLIILIPLFVLLSIIIKLSDGKSIFYFQERIGINGKKFKIIKFRTMKTNSDEIFKNIIKDKNIMEEWNNNYKLNNDPRMTKIGKILRIYSLDELPQLVNVLKGDMSLIGPRPIVYEELKKYGKYKKDILSVKPGITGWWVCNSTKKTTYEERVKLEYFYSKNVSLFLDLKCFFKTIYILILHKNK